ncbi:MAG: hypothetical protein PGN13_04830 [Patulibacter minatonensis]
MKVLSRSARTRPATPLSEHLAPRRSAPAAPSRDVLRPLLAIGAVLLIAALALPRDHGPAVPLDALRPVGTTSAHASTTAGDPQADDPAAATRSLPTGDSAASVVPTTPNDATAAASRRGSRDPDRADAAAARRAAQRAAARRARAARERREAAARRRARQRPRAAAAPAAPQPAVPHPASPVRPARSPARANPPARAPRPASTPAGRGHGPSAAAQEFGP